MWSINTLSLHVQQSNSGWQMAVAFENCETRQQVTDTTTESASHISRWLILQQKVGVTSAGDWYYNRKWESHLQVTDTTTESGSHISRWQIQQKVRVTSARWLILQQKVRLTSAGDWYYNRKCGDTSHQQVTDTTTESGSHISRWLILQQKVGVTSAGDWYYNRKWESHQQVTDTTTESGSHISRWLILQQKVGVTSAGDWYYNRKCGDTSPGERQIL